MKIVIVDAYHDSDRGGAGILGGLLNVIARIARTEDEAVEIAVVYRFSADDPRFQSAYRHTQKSYPNVTIYGSPAKTFRARTGVLSRRVESVVTGVLHLVRLLLPLLSRDPAVKVIKRADIVLSKGGHFYQFWQKDPAKGFRDAVIAYFPLLLAIRLQKRVALLGHTVGPFHNRAAEMLTRFVFGRAIYASTREPMSQEILSDLGVRSSRIEVLPDTAFALVPVSRTETGRLVQSYGLEERKYAVLTARYWSFPGYTRQRAAGLYKRYLCGIARIADFVVEAGYVDKVALMVHNDGQHSAMEDDRPPIREILAMMRRKDQAVVIEKDLSPAEQAGLYGSARLMIGTRLHSVIFALVGGAPAIAIRYNHKTDGIMGMLGLRDFVLPIDTFSVDDASAMIQRLLGSAEETVQLSEQNIARFRDTLDSTLRSLLF